MVDPLTALGFVARVRPPTFFEIGDVVPEPVETEEVVQKRQDISGDRMPDHVSADNDACHAKYPRCP